MRPSTFDICVNYSQFSRSLHREKHPQSRLHSRGSLIKSVFRRFKNIEKLNEGIKENFSINKPLVFFGTLNQFNVLQKMYANSLKIAPSSKGNSLPEANYYYLPWKEALYAILFSYQTFFDFAVEKDSFKKSTIWTGLASYFFANGSYQYWLSILKKLKPSEVVISNDYNYTNRALIFAAKKLNIKTVYIPHALIGVNFYTPPKMICDIVYVSGELEYFRIQKASSKNKNYQIRHLTRFEFQKRPELSNRGHTVGLSINSIDKLECLIEEIEHFQKQSPTYKIIIRPHPTMDSFLINKLGFEIDASLTLKDYFSKIDMHLAGSSMMHVDSILHGVPSFIFQYAINLDHYGFHQSGIVNSINELVTSSKRPELFWEHQKERVEILLISSIK